MPIFIFAGIAIAGFITAAVFWDQIREWAQTTLADSIGRILGAEAREVFLDVLVEADKFMSAVRRVAKKAWQVVREAIKSAVVTIAKVASNVYLKRLCAYIVKVVDGVEKVYRAVVEEEVPFEDLPDDARANFIRGSKQEVMHLQFGSGNDNN